MSNTIRLSRAINFNDIGRTFFGGRGGLSLMEKSDVWRCSRKIIVVIMVIMVISIMVIIKIRFELVWCNIISSNPTPASPPFLHRLNWICRRWKRSFSGFPTLDERLENDHITNNLCSTWKMNVEFQLTGSFSRRIEGEKMKIGNLKKLKSGLELASTDRKKLRQVSASWAWNRVSLVTNSDSFCGFWETSTWKVDSNWEV